MDIWVLWMCQQNNYTPSRVNQGKAISNLFMICTTHPCNIYYLSILNNLGIE